MSFFFERFFLMILFKIASRKCSDRISSLNIQVIVPRLLHLFFQLLNMKFHHFFFQANNGNLFILQLRTGILHENTLSGFGIGCPNCSFHFIHVLSATSLTSCRLKLNFFFIKFNFLQTFQFENPDKPVASFMKFSKNAFPNPKNASEPSF